MEHKLSIIIPCYNCESTLEEALGSVYNQDLRIPFEVIMVDDGSTDGTGELMKLLEKKYKHVRCITHERNRGGGAARNTGINNSDGDLIFCLDSDNFFAPTVLQKMIDYLDEKKCDGVVIEERRFFFANNPKKFKSHFNKIIGAQLEIGDLFKIKDGGIILDNFLFTKESFNQAGGYPESHGFDTQNFEIRFLSIGKTAYVCPGAIFYHRQHKHANSYFQRVYKAGYLSLNYYLICEDMYHLFSKQTRRMIMEFDILAHSKLDKENIKARLDSLYNDNPSEFFIKDMRRYLNVQGAEKYFTDHLDSSELEDIFCRAISYYKMGKYDQSVSCCMRLLDAGLSTKLVYYNMLRSAAAISMKGDKEAAELEVFKIAESLQPKKQKINPLFNFISNTFFN